MKVLIAILLLSISAIAGNISGRVLPVDVESWAAARTVIVVLRNDATIQAVRVNTFGYYQFTDVPPGEYEVIPFTAKARITFLPDSQFIVMSEANVILTFEYQTYNECLLSPCF